MKFCKYFLVLASVMCALPVWATTVVATVNGTPITDTDITARTKLMARQGQTATDNRRIALQSIIDDGVKLAYAQNFNAVPDDKTVDAELKKMNLGDDLSATEREMARNALKSEIAWQIIVARTIMPTIDVTDEDVKKERTSLAREHGLPIEMTIIRLTDVPTDVVAKLTKPKSCDAAIEMAESLGGAPQKFTALQYELAQDLRERVAGLPNMTWSPRANDGSVLLVCATKKTDEYKNLDNVIRQNAIYKQAMFMADQQLKQLRRRAVIVINDERYKL